MNKKQVWLAIAVLLAVAVLVEILFAHPHGQAFWDLIPGFDLLFGLLGSFLLIVVAKGILGPVFQKDTKYYDREGDAS